MGISRLLLLCILYCSLSVNAQHHYFFVSFKDKILTDNPSKILSQRSLDRRQKQFLSLHYTDYPVYEGYQQAVASKVSEVILTSRWLNGVLVIADLVQYQDINKLDFVKEIRKISSVSFSPNSANAICGLKSMEDFDYGNAYHQIRSLKADQMHNMCLDGKGILVTVFDGGFQNSDKIPSLSHIYDQNRLKFTWNVVDKNTYVYTRHTHGTNVLSTMAAFVPGRLIGTGFGADFALIITEDTRSEKRIEEYYWLKGAELADSIGTDIISSSLGYYDFDDPAENHHLEELDGKTTVITQAAKMAARKGILVVNSAGNNYQDEKWRKVVFPSDADSILSVGAVDERMNKASFSAVGPTSDGRIKPDLTAFGTGVTINNTGNIYSSASGTSYSAPLVAGLAAGLWQANPGITNMELREALLRSGSLNNNPDNERGAGVPDFLAAFKIIGGKPGEGCLANGITDGVYYPNPAEDQLIFEAKDAVINTSYQIMDLQGRIISEGIAQGMSKIRIDLSLLLPGVYILKTGEKQQKIVKL